MSNASLNNSNNKPAQYMTDVVFDLDGSVLPNSYPFAMWEEIVMYLPWLNEEKNAGILPLKGSINDSVTLLSKRTKLVLRVSEERASDTLSLTNKHLNIEGNLLIVGSGKERQFQASPTLHTYMVESKLDEVAFLEDMKTKLQLLNISCNLICDKHRKISGLKQTLSGFGLVLHDLKPQASLQIQRTGLGNFRNYGCGIFVPFKAISGLDS